MSLRFRQTFTLFPGVRLNIGKRGISASIGVPGATVNVGKKGVRATVGLPGTGLSYTTPTLPYDDGYSVLMNPLMILVKIIKLRWIHILSYDQMVSRKINNQTTRCANSIF
ncbi:DUF4236 domain-containing protein, partial [Escherichia coli]